ncbi:MAG: O-antigen ligase family protein [Propionibacteriaceae bacterium]|jgi:O-antigen ligase|nr:O-antigen ligase family protein [Propionibacteriaceae bacterium]
MAATFDPSTVEPRPADGRRLGGGEVELLTVYLVLLLAIPSSVRIAALGSMGRPSLLWGLVLFGWWVLWRLRLRPGDLPAVRQPVRLSFFALLTIALVSLSVGLLRGLPPDQVSPAVTSILRLLSWAGPMLIAMDGLRTFDEVMTMVRRLAIAGGLLAALGLLQFLTGQTLVNWYAAIPGLEMEVDSGIAVRGSFTRASGTSIHPLEHATALAAALPMAIALAISAGLRAGQHRGRRAGWLAATLIALGSVLAVSRSALIGFAVAALAIVPALPRRMRAIVLGCGGAIAAVAVIAVPGLFGTVVGLFAPGGDASTRSRTDALARLPQFLSPSPWFGTGFGTFLPRYYIFDNAWVLMLVELGVLGLLATLALFSSALYSAAEAAHRSGDQELKVVGRAVAASILAVGVTFAFFDGFSFPIAAGMAFVLFGLAGALRTVTRF